MGAASRRARKARWGARTEYAGKGAGEESPGGQHRNQHNPGGPVAGEARGSTEAPGM